MGNITLLFSVLFLGNAVASSIDSKVTCPHDPLETCRWEIAIRKKGDVVLLDWSKSVISRHKEKPLARPLECNVDRSFDEAAGGYLHVWFKDDKNVCDPLKQNPSECGVAFLEDGLTVKAPEGKVLERVEHFLTLDLQCGNFAKKDYKQMKLQGTLGWDAALNGDGTYVRSAAK